LLSSQDAANSPNTLTRSFLSGTAAGSVALPMSMSIVKGTYYHVRESISGHNINTYINGVLVDAWHDSTYQTGRVGFWTFEGNSDGSSLQRAHIDNVSVHSGGSTHERPAQVTGLVATNAGNGIKLTWTSDSRKTLPSGGANVSYYRVYR